MKKKRNEEEKLDYQELKILDYSNWIVFLHQNQCYLGHIYIWAKRDNFTSFCDQTPEELDELCNICGQVEKALKKLFGARVNWAWFTDEVKHGRFHGIPRYDSRKRLFDGIIFIDKNPDGNYSPYGKNFKVPKKTLFKIRDLIREELLKLQKESDNDNQYFFMGHLVPELITPLLSLKQANSIEKIKKFFESHPRIKEHLRLCMRCCQKVALAELIRS